MSISMSSRSRASASLPAAMTIALAALSSRASAQLTTLYPQGAVSPGTSTVFYDAPTQSYRFRFVGDETLEYAVGIGGLGVQQGIVRIQELTTGVYPVYSGGVVIADLNGVPLQPGAPGVTTALVARSLTGNTLTLTFHDTVDGITLERTHKFTLVGKSLKLRVTKRDSRRIYDDNYVGTTFGSSENAPSASRVIIPYMENMDVTMVGLNGGGLNSRFYQSFVDFTASNGSSVSKHQPEHAYLSGSSTRFVNGLDVHYAELSNAHVNPLDETFWITVTSSVADTFVQIDNPPSPHRSEMASAYVLNFSSVNGPSGQDYQRYTNYVDTMRAYGVQNMMIYLWGDWAKKSASGINLWPDALPPNPAPGTLAELQTLVNTAKSYGYRIGAYTYYYAFIDNPGNTYWDPSKATKDAAGNLKINAFGTPLLAPDAAVPVAASVEGAIQSLLGINLAYEDTLSGQLPGGELLSEWVPDGHVSTIRDAISRHKELFQQDKTIQGGPYLGEGALYMVSNVAFDSLYAGYVDGWERMLGDWAGGAPFGPAKNDLYYVIPDYELHVVKPQAVGLGFGFPQRFKDTPYPIPEADFDEFLATYISYGHVNYMTCNGIVGNNGDYLTEGDEIRSYYMLSASLQPLYVDSPVVGVGYHDGSVFRRLDPALKLGMDLRNPRLKINYENGLVVYVNHSATPWAPITVGGHTFTIPSNGWVAHHPCSGLLEFSAIPSGYTQRFDYVIKPGCFEMIDGRGQFTTFGGITGANFVVEWTNGFSVKEQATGLMMITGSLPSLCAQPWCP